MAKKSTRSHLLYLEDRGLEIYTKETEPVNKKNPPKLRGKHFSNLEYLADAKLEWLLEGQQSTLYDKTSDISYFEQCFLVIQKLGEGSHGSVLKVLNMEDKKFYAVKVSKEPFKNDFDRSLKVREVDSHILFSNHPNIVTLQRAWEEDRHLYMQMELCKEVFIKSHVIPESVCWEVLVDMVMALDHIHSFGMGHFDVKLENILQGYDGHYKLSDFGLAYPVNKKKQKVLPNEGDGKYLAPELLHTVPNFTIKADIFSLGISILEIAGNLILPANGPVWTALRENMFPQSHTKHLSNELLFLISRMMDSDLKLRPTTKEILDMPIIKTVIERRQERLAQVPLPLPRETLLPFLAVWELFSALVHLVVKSLMATAPQNSEFRNAFKVLNPSYLNEIYDKVDSELSTMAERTPMIQSRHCSQATSKSFVSAPCKNKKKSSSVTAKKIKFDNQSTSTATIDDEMEEVKDTSPEDWGVFQIPAISPERNCNSVNMQSPKSAVPPTSQRIPMPSTPSRQDSSKNIREHSLRITSPSILPFGISPVRLSQEIKNVVKANKRQRVMTPRNLSLAFEDDFES